jgi:putative membrane protein
VTLAILVVGVFVYIKITPYYDIALIKAGNTAATVSSSGTIIGFAVPLTFAMPAALRFMKF